VVKSKISKTVWRPNGRANTSAIEIRGWEIRKRPSAVKPDLPPSASRRMFDVRLLMLDYCNDSAVENVPLRRSVPGMGIVTECHGGHSLQGLWPRTLQNKMVDPLHQINNQTSRIPYISILETTRSIIRYSAACSADMKVSRLVSASICSNVWPVCSSRMRLSLSLVFLYSAA